MDWNTPSHGDSSMTAVLACAACSLVFWGFAAMGAGPAPGAAFAKDSGAKKAIVVQKAPIQAHRLASR